MSFGHIIIELKGGIELNRMETKIGLNAFLNKIVVVKFIDDDRGFLTATTGVLTDFSEDYEDEKKIEPFIVISSETDYERILLDSVRKIFLKDAIK